MASASSGQYLTFSLGDGVFAIDIACVREIIQQGALTPVPLMPDFVRGVLNLRGAVVPVIDLQVRFGKGQAGMGKKSCVIIFDGEHAQERVPLGLLVDAVSEVLEIPPSQIEPPPAFGTAIRRDFISGMGKVGGAFIILLDPQRALDIEEMALLADAGQPA